VTVVAAGQEGAMAIAPTPTSAPHWYKKSVELPAGGPHVSVATSGNLTLQALSKEAICKVTDTEEIWNPLGGGAGQDSVTAFKLQCKSKNLCPLHTSTEVLAKGLPWPSHLLAGAPVRDEIEQIKLEVRCNGGYLDEFTGALTPEVGAGALVFGAGSGALHDGFGNPATVSGSDKLKAPPGKITAQ